ncbi:MAG: cupin domain-containing protein [Bacteroidota bacterium]
MATAGITLENPLRGEEFTFLKTSEETKGQEICLYVKAQPGFPVPPLHKHPRQKESVLVESGYMCIKFREKEVILGPGDYFEIMPGVEHAWYNPREDEELSFTFQLSPALDSELMLETMLSLIKQGKVNKSGKLHWFQQAVLTKRYAELMQQESTAFTNRKWLHKMGAPIGKLLGYKSYVPYPERFV